MLDLEQIKEHLKDENVANVARCVGCSRGYLNNLLTGNKDNPSLQLMVKLSDYFQDKGEKLRDKQGA